MEDEEMLQERKRIISILVFICALQLAVSIFWGSKKSYLFFDEVFSYKAANSTNDLDSEFLENTWMDESWFLNFMSADSEHRFEYSIPYQNQVEDVHPPLFYLFLHTTCSMIPEEFSYWAGISVNILFFVGCTIVLYFLGKEIFGNPTCGLLVGLLYAVSYGGINTMVYIRMYMLLTLMTLLHALVYIKYFEAKVVDWKAYAYLALTLVLGVLSQYYFLFVAFFFGIWYTIKLFFEKRYQVLCRYILTVAISAVGSLIIWPSMIIHLFGGGRGEEARGNLLALEGYFSSIRETFRIINNDMFTKMLPIILVGILVLLFINKRKGYHIEAGNAKKAFAVFFVCFGYFLLVTKVAPYMVDRYVMPIYPLVYLLVIGVVYKLLEKIIPVKYAIVLCMIGFGGLSAIHMVHSGIPYTYAKHADNLERQEIAAEYHDKYALYISDNKGAHYYDAVQMLKEYKGYYYVYDLTLIEQTQKDMDVIANEDSLIVYVKDKRSFEEAKDFVENVFPGCSFDKDSRVDEDEKWDVYLIDLKVTKE